MSPINSGSPHLFSVAGAQTSTNCVCWILRASFCTDISECVMISLVSVSYIEYCAWYPRTSPWEKIHESTMSKSGSVLSATPRIFDKILQYVDPDPFPWRLQESCPAGHVKGKLSDDWMIDVKEVLAATERDKLAMSDHASKNTLERTWRKCHDTAFVWIFLGVSSAHFPRCMLALRQKTALMNWDGFRYFASFVACTDSIHFEEDVDFVNIVIVWTLHMSKNSPKTKSCKWKWVCLCVHLSGALSSFRIITKCGADRDSIKNDSYPKFSDSDRKVLIKDSMVKTIEFVVTLKGE